MTPQCCDTSRACTDRHQEENTTERLRIFDPTALVGVPSLVCNSALLGWSLAVTTLSSRDRVLVWMKVGRMYPCFITDTCATVDVVSGMTTSRCHRSTRVDGALHANRALPCLVVDPSDQHTGMEGTVWHGAPVRHV